MLEKKYLYQYLYSTVPFIQNLFDVYIPLQRGKSESPSLHVLHFSPTMSLDLHLQEPFESQDVKFEPDVSHRHSEIMWKYID